MVHSLPDSDTKIHFNDLLNPYKCTCNERLLKTLLQLCLWEYEKFLVKKKISNFKNVFYKYFQIES